MKHFSAPALIFTLLLHSCSPDFRKDGGVRITMELSMGDFIRKNVYPNDSLAIAMIDETYLELQRTKGGSFLHLYFDNLEKASSVKPRLHFSDKAIPMMADSKQLMVFFDEKFEQVCNRTKVVLDERLDKFGVFAQAQRVPGTNRFIIEIPGEYDRPRLRGLLQSSADLEFWETYEAGEIYGSVAKLNSILSAQLYPELHDTIIKKDSLDFNEQLDADSERMRKENPLFELLVPAFDYDDRSQVTGIRHGPVIGYAKVKDTTKISDWMRLGMRKRFFPSTLRFAWTGKPYDPEGAMYQLVLLRLDRLGRIGLSGEMITDARVVFDDDSGGSPQISMEMNPVAAGEWREMTRDNIGRSVAIVLDGSVYSYPTVNSEISGGRSSITGNFTKEEAQDLANILKAGALPVRIAIVAEELVAPQK